MHSPDDDTRLSAADQAYAIQRAKQLLAASRDPAARSILARQIFEDAFTKGATHARRLTVPDVPPPPLYGESDHDNARESERYTHGLAARLEAIADNARKLRALLWARNVFLEQRQADYADALEGAIREWFLCTLPELPRDTAAIERAVRGNAGASWATLKRVALARIREAAE